MAGGRGTRLAADTEKPLFEVGGRPMIGLLVDALVASQVEDVYVATSAATPATREYVDVPCIETAGDGYVADLEAALADGRLAEPILTVAADLPLLSPVLLNRVVDAHEAGSITVAVPVGLKEALGVSVDDHLLGDDWWAPAGLNVVGGGESTVYRSWDVRLAVNVNRPGDALVAETLVDPRKN